ncbi:MAG: substrate-binding domain-containing protein [Aquincola sp.]|nr:substrate-binding domain-containing protein [Aquincola sp.]
MPPDKPTACGLHRTASRFALWSSRVTGGPPGNLPKAAAAAIAILRRGVCRCQELIGPAARDLAPFTLSRHTLQETPLLFRSRSLKCAAALAALVLTSCASAPDSKPTSGPPSATSAAPAAAASHYAVIPPNKDSDLKLYRADGRIAQGAQALGAMQRDAQVVLWLAGNQFFAMDDVVRAFQKQNPGASVGLITLPPGLLLEAIEKGGWVYGGVEYAGLPDVYASVNLGHLQKLKRSGLADRYSVYMHNEMVLMVARGNPKRVAGVADVMRADVRTSMPNPVNEGIMQFYGRKVLERRGAWQHVAAGKECVSCQTTPNNWFTAVHHRETPERILAGTSDTGIVWLTEAIEAQREGKAVEAVRLPPEDSMRDEVAYAVCALTKGSRQAMAARYLDFLASADAQAAYAKFGFVNASAQELTLKPIP